MRFKLMFICVLGLVVGSPACAAQNQAADVRAIQYITEQFRTAIINKDKARFVGLFFSEDPARVNWQFVVDDAGISRLRETKPDAKKARYVPQSNYLSFIDSVVTNASSSEEVFSDISIDTDGEVASVNFNYTYLQAGQPTNDGREMWQLVRTEQGWKIISVIWSIHDPRPSRAS